ncbi:hypothetical protein [EBPR siphovirus 4]|nr:hypothetical protein [EBPR siphovirus 4]
MVPALLTICLIVLVLAAAAIRAWAVAAQVNKAAAAEAQDALNTTRRIHDATRNPPSVDAARGWLRNFGGDDATGKR